MDEFNFAGDTTGLSREAIEEEETTPKAEETVEEEAEETTEKVEEEAKETTEEEEPVEEEKKDSKIQALDAERARRKQVEKELKELKAKLSAEENAKAEAEELAKRKESLKADILKDDLVDEEVANKLVETLGSRLIKGEIESERRAKAESFEKELEELKKEDMFKDADDYKPEIKELMSKGLTMEQAYFASIGKNKLGQKMKDLRVEVEQEVLNQTSKADKIDVGHEESSNKAQAVRYTKKEQEIANETGLSVKDVHKRMSTFNLDDMLNL